MTLATLNALDRAGFVAALGAIYEHSPWVAEEVWPARPFQSIDALAAAMGDAVARAPRPRKLALLAAHPELAGQQAAEGSLTASSTGEQGRLGFTALSRAELDAMTRLNRAYRERFGFPAIVALARHAGRDTVTADIERRMRHDPESEIATALAEVSYIARTRLDSLIEAG